MVGGCDAAPNIGDWSDDVSHQHCAEEINHSNPVHKETDYSK
jgi:hypothetical protein